MKSELTITRRCIYAATLIMFLWPVLLQAEEASISSKSGIYKEIDSYLDGQLELLHIPGAAMAVVEGAEIAHFYSFGEARPGGESPGLATPFILGSLTKSITAMAIMQLADQGKIDPDTSVQDYLPWFRLADSDAAETITVRHLLNQTGGLSMFTGMKLLANFDDSPDACEKRARELETFMPPRAPGEAFEYSDVNYNLLGLVIEAASGESYSNYIERHIFVPLGMNNSHTGWVAAAEDGVAIGHTMCFGFTKPELNMPRPIGSTPSGQLVSSVGDMARYMSTMLDGGSLDGIQILSTENTSELVRPAVSAGSMGVEMGDYAMGWFVEDEQGELRIWHDGMVPDFFSYMVLLPETDRGFILLVNANHMIINYSLLDVCEAVTDIMTGRPVETEDMHGEFLPLRLFLVIPILQILGIIFIANKVRRWRRFPTRRPGKPVLYGFYIILAPLPHFILAAAALVLLFMGMGRFMMLFMPDLTWILFISGGISIIWLVLRILLILWAVKLPIRQRREGFAVV